MHKLAFYNILIDKHTQTVKHPKHGLCLPLVRLAGLPFMGHGAQYNL